MKCVKVATLVSAEIDCEDLNDQLLCHKDKSAIINGNVGNMCNALPLSLSLHYNLLTVCTYLRNFAGTTAKGAVDDLDLVIQKLEETGFTRLVLHPL